MRNRLKDARRDAKMTQCELSRRSGISRSTISMLENGRKEGFSTRTLDAIADALAADIRTIFF